MACRGDSIAYRTPDPPSCTQVPSLVIKSAGGLALVFATTAYYRVDVLFDGGAWWGMAIWYWLIGSVWLGPLLGVAGALIRRRGPVGTLAVLLVPAGAALQMVLLPPPPDSRMAGPVRLTVWVAAAVATVLIARRIGRRGPAVSPAGQR